MDKDIEALKLEWQDASTTFNDKKVYSLLLKIFKQYIPLMAKKDPPPGGWQLIAVLKPILLQMVEKHYEKSAQIREVLTQIYDSTFNIRSTEPAQSAEMYEDQSPPKPERPSPELHNGNKPKRPKESSGLQELQKAQNAQEAQKVRDANESQKSAEIEHVASENDTDKPQLIPPDAQGSEFFKSKIQKLVEQEIGNFYSLLDYYPNQDKTDFLEIVLHLIEVYPDSPGILISKIQKSMESGTLTADQFKILFKKCIDKDPSAIVFSTFTNLQEKMLDATLSPQEILFFEAVFEVIEEYIQYYPDFFSNQINLYVGLLGKYNTKITELVAKIIIFYAKNGEERVEELFFEIFEKLDLLSELMLDSLVHAMHDALDSNRTFILEKHFQNDRFDKDIIRSVYSRFKNAKKGIQELAFEIAIAMWNFTAQIHIMHQESQGEILKSIVLILKQLHSLKIYSPYILMQAIRDIDNLISELNPTQNAHEFENLYINDKNFDTAAIYFETLQHFLKKLKDLD